MSEDWLDIGEREGEGGHLPVPVTLPDDYKSRLALVESCWARLTEKQKIFLQAWRDCRYNALAACRQLGLGQNTKPMTSYSRNPDFAMVVRVWRANAAADALDRDRLLARQDDIVETLLTPKPILHQGVPTGFEEVEAGAAARANETLMQAAGLLKSKDEVNVNVGVYSPVQVEVEKPAVNVIDATEVVEVDPVVPE